MTAESSTRAQQYCVNTGEQLSSEALSGELPEMVQVKERLTSLNCLQKRSLSVARLTSLFEQRYNHRQTKGAPGK